MKFLLKLLKNQEHHFHRGGKLERFKPLWEAQETFLFTPGQVTERGPHVRDSMDLKRLMITVVLALVPCTIFGIYNAGYQSAKALGILGHLSHLQLFANGAFLVLPIIVVSYAVGGLWETVFSIVRKHPISEGFLVTGLLFPLTLPPTMPLWQVALGVSFGVVIGKEIFGGTGMNVLNPALTARVFLFFSFPVDISGADPWVMTDASRLLFGGVGAKLADGFSGATALLVASDDAATHPAAQFLASNKFHDLSLWNMFLGLEPGSIGETSALMCLIGAVILIITGVGSWQIMVSMVAGAVVTAGFVNSVSGPGVKAIFDMPPQYHLVAGGFAFGAVYMATDPVSAAATNTGKYIYGFLIGLLTVLIRLVNPAYPEGVMLSILFMNIFAPLIDYFVVKRNITRRKRRAEATG